MSPILEAVLVMAGTIGIVLIIANLIPPGDYGVVRIPDNIRGAKTLVPGVALILAVLAISEVPDWKPALDDNCRYQTSGDSTLEDVRAGWELADGIEGNNCGFSILYKLPSPPDRTKLYNLIVPPQSGDRRQILKDFCIKSSPCVACTWDGRGSKKSASSTSVTVSLKVLERLERHPFPTERKYSGGGRAEVDAEGRRYYYSCDGGE